MIRIMIMVYALSAEMQNAGSCTNRYSCGQLPIFERRARAAPMDATPILIHYPMRPLSGGSRPILIV